MEKAGLALNSGKQVLQPCATHLRFTTRTCKNIGQGALRGLITLKDRRLPISEITVGNEDALCTKSLPPQSWKRLPPLVGVCLSNEALLGKARVHVQVPNKRGMVRQREAMSAGMDPDIRHQVRTNGHRAPKQYLIKAHAPTLLLPVWMELQLRGVPGYTVISHEAQTKLIPPVSQLLGAHIEIPKENHGMEFCHADGSGGNGIATLPHRLWGRPCFQMCSHKSNLSGAYGRSSNNQTVFLDHLV
jgi:hypothetical protein